MAIKDFIDTKAPLQPISPFDRLLSAMSIFSLTTTFSFFKRKMQLRLIFIISEVNTRLREIIFFNVSNFAPMMGKTGRLLMALYGEECSC
ncbi:hypothetical protein CEE39_06865 [bacterium (candidate division B38) B3_B38]|nr:MAG: hypothetical protein CEE39_06865 [bacterium (candidate division B38) B3_B38]